MWGKNQLRRGTGPPLQALPRQCGPQSERRGEEAPFWGFPTRIGVSYFWDVASVHFFAPALHEA